MSKLKSQKKKKGKVMPLSIYDRYVQKHPVIVKTFRHEANLILPRPIIDGIYKALKDHGEIYIERLGKLSITMLPRRKGYNPQTGKSVKYPEVAKLKFRSGEESRRIINNE